MQNSKQKYENKKFVQKCQIDLQNDRNKKIMQKRNSHENYMSLGMTGDPI